RLLLIGGEFGEPYFPDHGGNQPYGGPDVSEAVFALDLAPSVPVWRQLAPAGSGPDTYRGVAVYDPFADRVVTFGGSRCPDCATRWIGPPLTNDVYALD